ncbi:hypothetical protein [uncultured Alistipes sp.]|uniref:hypothetical protein n=1 Tax=uncultured Alistipes sp. TaxID=538949 RepID=UPI0027299047|nr:hypothetical protein [uncultured Alistipes sp.]
MKTKQILSAGLVIGTLCLGFGCSITGPLQRQQVAPELSQLSRAERQELHTEQHPQVVKLQRDSNTFYLAPVDTLANGERVMSLQIEQVTVVSKMRSIPERNGQVRLDFMITLPKQLLGGSRSVVITPVLHKPDGRMEMEDLVIRGGRFSLLQQRDYWQYKTYIDRFRPDTLGRAAAFNRFVKFPYPEDTRLDSVMEQRGRMTYYYSEEVPTDETSKRMMVTLEGKVVGIDDSAYRLPPSDTLDYVVSSMLSFVDTLLRQDTTYMRGVELLKKRKYAEALYILNNYNDRNTVVAHLSMDHNEWALELLAALPKDAVTEYLRAIACARLGRKEEGRRDFLEACRLDERMEYRSNLDPEITELLKD